MSSENSAEKEALQLLMELLDAVDEMLKDPDIQKALPKKVKFVITIALKIIRVLVKSLM